MLTFVLMLLVVGGACGGLGWLMFQVIRGRNQTIAIDWLEAGFASLGLGIAIMGWLVVTLAELGLFSLAALGVGWLVLALLLAWWLWRQGISWQLDYYKPHSSHLILLLWLPVAGWLFLRPHESIQGGADAGVYVSLAANIAYTGQILVHDPALADLNPVLVPAFLRPLPDLNFAEAYQFPGFYASDTPGELIPQFYPLHPVWQAVAFAFGGDPVSGTFQALRLVGIWALLGSLAMFFTVRRLAGLGAAWLALAAITANALQIWFARYSVTESLSQYLLWTGLWAFGLWLEGVLERESRPQWGLLAGLMLGSTQLARIDMFFVLALPAAAFLYLWLRPQTTRLGQHVAFFLPVLLLTTHSVIHALWQSRPYFFDTFGYIFRYSQRNPEPVLLGVLGLGAILLVGWSGRGRWRLPDQWIKSLQWVLSGGVLLWGLYGWFLRPAWEGISQSTDWFSESARPVLDAINFWRLGWYLGPLGIGLAVVAMAWLVLRLDRRTLAWFAVGFFFSLLYLWRAQASPHQIYVMRRYVPVVLPFFLSAAAIFLAYLIDFPSLLTWRLKNKWQVAQSGAGILLSLIWLGGLLWLAQGFVTQVDHVGLTQQLAHLDAQLPTEAILIFNDAAAVGQADFVGTPLRFIFERTVFVWRDAAATDVATLRQQLRHWQEQGHSLYWTAVPGGHPWPFTDTPLPPATPYSITTQALEGSYEHRPQQINNIQWNLELTLIPDLQP